jgi:hypothetical protein
MRPLATALSQSAIIAHGSIWLQTFCVLGNFYCRQVHNSVSRPVNGKYRCWKCLREFDLELVMGWGA